MAMTLSTLDTMVQRSETAIKRQLRKAQRQERLAKLTTELQKRPWIALHPLAKEIGLTNRDRIYKILNGDLPTPEDFIDNVCLHTGIPLKAVLSDEEYRARVAALSYEMTVEDIEGRDWKGF